MEQIILNAVKREKGNKKFKEEGFLPGVIYGDSIAKADSVKFVETELKKILTLHGSNVKLWIQCGESKKFGLIKEIQRHPVTNKITHIDIQLVSKDHEIKLQIAIIFKGESALAKKQLQLQVHKSEIDVVGKIDSVPEAIHVDVSEKNPGDTITSKDFELGEGIKIDKENEVYATITRVVIEEVEEEETTEVKPEAKVEAKVEA